MKIKLKIMTVASLLMLAQGASAADCTAATVKGTWGFSYDAANLDSRTSCVGVGLITFSTGTFSNNSVKITAQRNSCDGDPATTFTASGSYSVAAACTGKSTNLKYASSKTASKLDFNVVEAGTRIQFVLVQGNGITLHGDAFKR